MELSLKSKFKSEAILERRRKVILDKKLHIKDMITYENFENLYMEYGYGFTREEFAQVILDIEDVKYQNLRKGKNTETTILSREYVSNEEFEKIRDRVVKEYGIKTGDKINYSQVMEMYNKHSGKLSIDLFSEEILGIPIKKLRTLKKELSRFGNVNLDISPGKYAEENNENSIPMEIYNPNYINELRRNVILNENLHIGDSISYEQLKELHQKYCSFMPESMFALEILDINLTTLNRIKGPRASVTVILMDTYIPEEYIKYIRRIILTKKNLRVGQLLNYSELQKLYNEFGGVLNEKKFAFWILQIPEKYHTELQEGLYESTTILKFEEPDDLKGMRDIIVSENKLHYDDLMEYSQFHVFHQKYAPTIPESTFAKEIFDISDASFQYMKYNGGRARILLNLPLPTKEECWKIQKRIISDNGLQIDDTINYEELTRLHSIYGGITSINIFGTEILAMNSQGVDRIKRDKTKSAFVLHYLEIPDAEITATKDLIMKNHNLREPRELTFAEIEELHKVYGKPMPLVMFTREILGIDRKTLNNFKKKSPESTITVRVSRELYDEELESLIQYLAQGLSELEISRKLGIRISFLREKLEELIIEGIISDDIIRDEKIRQLKKQGNSITKISESLSIPVPELKEKLEHFKGQSRQAKEEKKKEKEQIRKEKKVEKDARKVIENYEYNESNIQIARTYIEQCFKKFKAGEFQKSSMKLLRECLTFAVCDFQDILVFTEMCVNFGESRMAVAFIQENILNDGISVKEKGQLNQLKSNIMEAIKNLEAFEIVKNGIVDIATIAEITGAQEESIKRLLNSINSKKSQKEDLSI